MDIDDGYGDEKISTNVVRRLEQAHASGVIFEDQKRPKKCGHLPGKEVLPTATYIKRLEALLKVRRDLFIVARTDAPFEDGLGEALGTVAVSTLHPPKGAVGIQDLDHLVAVGGVIGREGDPPAGDQRPCRFAREPGRDEAV